MQHGSGSSEHQRTTIEELERFRQEIERHRARRKAVSEEFEGFVRSFKQPQPAPPQDQRPRRDSAARRQPAPPRAAVPPELVRDPVPPPPTYTAPTPANVRVDADRPWRPTAVLGAVALLVAVLAAAAVWLLMPGPATSPEPAATSGVTSPPATGLPPVAAPADPHPAVGTAAPGSAGEPKTPAAPVIAQSELTTTRPVWVRLIADGDRIVNRELPAGTRLPFDADATIEVRAGDAGAVRISVAGRDQGTLGRDGQVVTRTYNVPEIRKAP